MIASSSQGRQKGKTAASGEGASAKPTPKIKKAPHKPAPIPDFDRGNFYVQVGAFVKIENARMLARAFAKRGAGCGDSAVSGSRNEPVPGADLCQPFTGRGQTV